MKEGRKEGRKEERKKERQQGRSNNVMIKCAPVKKKKVNFIPGLQHHAIKMYWGSGDIAPLIL
jgi:hypothetical protein